MDKRKIIGALMLAGGGFALWWYLRPKAPVINPLTGTPIGPISTIMPLATTGLPASQAAALSTINVPGVSVASVPAGVPAGSKLLGYYTPAGAKHYNGIFYQNGSTFYIYNVNQKKVSTVGAKSAAVFINSPQFAAAH